MPHAEKDTYAAVANGDSASNNSFAPLVNGEKTSQSKVLSHLQSYPVIADTLNVAKSHPYGAKSLSLLNQTYASLIRPITPYMSTPYSYLSPYLSRADELGDNGLSKVDSKFPVVKEGTEMLRERFQAYAYAPLLVAGHVKEYALGTWEDEYQKTRGEDGVVKKVKALISTELKMGLDGYKFVSEYWKRGKEVASKKVDEVQQK